MESADADFTLLLALTCSAVENEWLAETEGCGGLRRVAEEHRIKARKLLSEGLDVVR